MTVASLQDMLEAGVHFGHQVHRWNPKMKKYIWGERNGIYIIDLTQTSELLDQAYNFVKDKAAKGKKIVFVGTKKQAADIVKEEADRCGAYFINRRWLGGTLTNFETIRGRINRLRELEDLRDNGHFDRLGKKEAAVLTRQLAKLDKSLGGLKTMRGLPDVVFVIDQRRELIAVKEANKSNIPVIGMVDTNCDPDNVDFVIPANDDATRSIRLIVGKMADAIIEGNAIREGSKDDGNAKSSKGKSAKSVTVEEMTAGKDGAKKADTKSEAKAEAKSEANVEEKEAVAAGTASDKEE